MSIGSPLEIRTQLGSALGKAGLPYWNKLRDFLIGKLGRAEFEELIRQWINTPELVLLHNSLIYAVLQKASQPPAQENNIAPAPGPPRKKRKLLPHQDPPPRLTRWVLGMGKSERARIRNSTARRGGVPATRSFENDITSELPIKKLQEGTYRAGTHVALPLSTVTRTLPTMQQLTGRMDLIASQHQMTASKSAASLLAAGVEAFLKQVTVHALAATSSTHPFASISPVDASAQPPLAPSSFSTLFTVAPFEIPMPTAVVTELIINAGAAEDDDDDDDLVRLERTLDPVNRQIVRTLMGRSGMRDMLRNGTRKKLQL